MFGFEQSFTLLGSILANVLKGVVENIARKQLQDAYTAFIQKQGRFVNNDLEKALRRSFLLAQYSIASECRQELVQSSRMVYRYSLRIGTLEHEPEIRQLGKKIKQLNSELNKVKQLKQNATPIESLNELGLLLTQESKLDEKRVDIKQKLLAEAVEDDSVPCYKTKAEASLLQRMCAYFAFEIKTNAAVRDMLQTQLLAEINLTSKDLEKSLQDVAIAVPQLVEKLDNWRVAIQSNFDKVKASLEDVMQVVTRTAKTVEQIEDKLDRVIEAKPSSPSTIYVIVVSGNLNEIQPQLPTIVARIQQASGDITTEFIDVKKGSVLLFFEGSQEGFVRLEELFRSGELQQILGVTVEAVQFITEDTPVAISQMVVNLSQWLDNVIEGTWQTVEDVLGTQRANQVFPARSVPLSEGVVRAIQFDLEIEPTSASLALVVAVIPNNQEMAIRLQVHPTGSKTYLPPGLKCLVLDTSGKILLEVQAKNYDERMQLNINGKPGEQFRLLIQIGDAIWAQNFMI